MNFNMDQFDEPKYQRSRKDSASLPTENSVHMKTDNYEFFPPNQFIDKSNQVPFDSLAISKISKNSDASSK